MEELQREMKELEHEMLARHYEKSAQIATESTKLAVKIAVLCAMSLIISAISLGVVITSVLAKKDHDIITPARQGCVLVVTNTRPLVTREICEDD